MKRRVLNLLTALSLLLCVGSCALWVRSYWRDDWVYRGADRVEAGTSVGATEWTVTSSLGRFTATRVAYTWLDAGEVGPRKPDAPTRGWLAAPAGSIPVPMEGPFYFICHEADTPSRPRIFSLGSHYAAPSLAFASLPLLWLYRRLRGKQRPGLCPQCGYDLRGNVSGVCPECGQAA